MQLSCVQGVPIAAETIHESVSYSLWHVLVWACRNGIAFNFVRVEYLLHCKHAVFADAEQKEELLALLPKKMPCIDLRNVAAEIEHSRRRRK